MLYLALQYSNHPPFRMMIRSKPVASTLMSAMLQSPGSDEDSASEDLVPPSHTEIANSSDHSDLNCALENSAHNQGLAVSTPYISPRFLYLRNRCITMAQDFPQFKGLPLEIKFMVVTETVLAHEPEAPINVNLRRIPYYQDRMMRSYTDIAGPREEKRWIAHLEGSHEHKDNFSAYARAYPKYLPRPTTDKRFLRVSVPKSRFHDFTDGMDWQTIMRAFCTQRKQIDQASRRGPLAFAFVSKDFTGHCICEWVKHNTFQLRVHAQNELLYCSGRFVTDFYPSMQHITSLNLHVSSVPDLLVPVRVKPYQRDGVHDLAAYSYRFPNLRSLKVVVEMPPNMHTVDTTRPKMLSVLKNLLHGTPFADAGCYNNEVNGLDGKALDFKQSNLLLLFPRLRSVEFFLRTVTDGAEEPLLHELENLGVSWKDNVETIIKPVIDG